MPEFNKYSTDGGATFIDVEDSNAVHVGDESLLKNTLNPTLTEYPVTSGGDGVGSIETINDSPVPNFNKSFRITGNTTGNRDFSYGLSSKLPHGYYRFRVFARSLSGTVTAIIRIFGGNNCDSFIKNVGTSWALIDAVLDASIFSANISACQFGINGAGSIEFIKPELIFLSKEEIPTTILNGASNFSWFGVADGTYSDHGIDYTINNSEGSVVLNGRTTGQSTCILTSTNKKMKLKAGKYKVSGMDKGGAYLMFNRPDTGTTGKVELSLAEGYQIHNGGDYGYGATFSATNDTDFGTTGNFYIRIDSANVEYDNVKIYPRIELLSTDCADNDYQSYTMTNKELTDNVIPENITSDYFDGSLPTGVSTISDRTAIYKIGKLVIVNALLYISGGLDPSSNLTISIKSKYSPVKQINNSCTITKDEWESLSTRLAYLYFSTSGDHRMAIRDKESDAANYKYAKISISYVLP